MNIEQTFGPEKPLQEFQVERLRKIQEACYVLAKAIVDNTPNVSEREAALETLKSVKALADAAARQSRSVLTAAIVTNLFAITEARNTRVTRLWLNVVDYADLRKFSRDLFDAETDVANLRQGIQGRIWGAEVRTSRKIPEGFAVVIGEDQGDADRAPVPALGTAWEPTPEQLIRF